MRSYHHWRWRDIPGKKQGHHIDSLMGPEDAAGDEGEVFQRFVMGEDPAGCFVARQRRNDHGIIRNGEKTITVEFRVSRVSSATLMINAGILVEKSRMV